MITCCARIRDTKNVHGKTLVMHKGNQNFWIGNKNLEKNQLYCDIRSFWHPFHLHGKTHLHSICTQMQIMDKTTLPAVSDAKFSDIFRTRHITSAEIVDKDSHLNERNYKKATILCIVCGLHANSYITYYISICIVTIKTAFNPGVIKKKRKMWHCYTFFSFSIESDP